MRAAVIGAGGFIGRRLSHAILDRGDSLTVLARDPRQVSDLAERGAVVASGGLRDEDAVSEVCSGADVVFNAAGALGKWGTSTAEMEFVNGAAAGLVVRCSRGALRVVHVSTAGVSGPLPDGVMANEDYPDHPNTDYQRTKLSGERHAIAAHRATGRPLTIVRPSFVYGPGDTHKLSLFRATAARRMALVDSGRSLLHPVYVDDLVDGILQAAARAPGEGEALILGGAKPASTRELLTEIAAMLSVPPPSLCAPSRLLLVMADAAEWVGRALGKEPPLTRSKVRLFSENYAYDIGRARFVIGYDPPTSLSEGMRLTVEWYRRAGLLCPAAGGSGC